ETIETKESELRTLKRFVQEKEEKLEEKFEEKRKTFTEAEAKNLVLKKFYDLAAAEMHRYLNARTISIIDIFENLWDKYRITMLNVQSQRDEAAKQMTTYIKELGYVD